MRFVNGSLSRTLSRFAEACAGRDGLARTRPKPVPTCRRTRALDATADLVQNGDARVASLLPCASRRSL
jgi:hypothetical protein